MSHIGEAIIKVKAPKLEKAPKSVIDSMEKQYAKTDPSKLKTCLQLVKKGLLLIKDGTKEELTVKKDSNSFQAKIAPVNQAVELYEACGFTDTGDALQIQRKVEGCEIYTQAVERIDVVLKNLECGPP